ncbi:HNH endonuclease [Seinonella peptonophila]|uniref:HNH endonuclease n=1 Tax=Seinonella peptonophila TaxID=112248 RepID=UPI003BF54F4A
MRGFSDEQKRTIKKRDNDCCQLCSSSKRQRQIHHLFSQSSYPLLANVLLNGLTLCEICHAKFHDFCPNGTNSGDDFLIFLDDQFNSHRFTNARRLKKRIAPIVRELRFLLLI